jgi:hypothetical protein
MFANTYNKNFRLSTQYLAGTFVYYTPASYDCISIVKGGSTTYTSGSITGYNAKAQFDGLKLHLQDPMYDPFRR